ncbi:integrase core domain-containing protein [bacterium]|nr:integrase core domain-containing protein [bacterium]
MKSKIKDRKTLRFNDHERIRLAKIRKQIGLKALKEISCIVRPETILEWFRKMVAKKFDGSLFRKRVGRPKTNLELESLIVKIAEENPSWGYDRIVGALSNLGFDVSDQTVGNILKKHGIPPAPNRSQETTWSTFIKNHQDVIAACDFFTTEVITPVGLITYYVIFFINIGSRKVHIAGITPHPNESWMKQMARNVTMEDWGFLSNCKYLIHDRDTTFCKSFQAIIASMGIKPIRLPPQSQKMNSFVERFVGSVRRECLNKLIFFGEESLRNAFVEYTDHYHRERNHQGKNNLLLFPNLKLLSNKGQIKYHKRLSGMLKYYYRSAA